MVQSGNSSTSSSDVGIEEMLKKGFGKQLASPSPKVRNLSVQALVQWLQSQDEMPQLEYLRVWKGLYFCFWMSDKRHVQHDLAEQLSQCILSMKVDVAKPYFAAALHTVQGAWASIDYLRLDKYYDLVRCLLRAGGKWLHEQDYDLSICQWFSTTMAHTFLSCNPHSTAGLRLQMCECFIEECLSDNFDQIGAESFKALISPVIAIVVVRPDQGSVSRAVGTFIKGLVDKVLELDDKVKAQFLGRLCFCLGAQRIAKQTAREQLYSFHSKLKKLSKESGTEIAALTDVIDTTVLEDNSVSMVNEVMQPREFRKSKGQSQGSKNGKKRERERAAPAAQAATTSESASGGPEFSDQDVVTPPAKKSRKSTLGIKPALELNSPGNTVSPNALTPQTVDNASSSRKGNRITPAVETPLDVRTTPRAQGVTDQVQIQRLDDDQDNLMSTPISKGSNRSNTPKSKSRASTPSSKTTATTPRSVRFKHAKIQEFVKREPASAVLHPSPSDAGSKRDNAPTPILKRTPLRVQSNPSLKHVEQQNAAQTSDGVQASPSSISGKSSPHSPQSRQAVQSLKDDAEAQPESKKRVTRNAKKAQVPAPTPSRRSSRLAAKK